ncbi:MAG: hypothetical protein JWO38_3047, partial [Gemmataceae bacterium]|nr:hypothetical protein [Gemmataceae bacterium]
MSDPRRTRLTVEPLECRCVPTVITVTGVRDSTARDGVVTLREAILAANTHHAVGDAPAPAPGPVTIKFNIPGGGLHTIRPWSGLPTLNGGVTIDATSQPGYTGTPLIQLDGSAAGSNTDALTLLGGHNTVRGLLIDRWGGRGIVIASDNNVLTGDWVGVDETGYRAAGNGQDGIVVAGSSNLIGDVYPGDRMVISGNRLAGIDVSGARTTGNLIISNYIGTDANGFA